MCNRCSTNSIDNEFHFLFECKSFDDIRQLYLPNLPNHLLNDSDDALVKLLNDNNPCFIDNLITYICQSGVMYKNVEWQFSFFFFICIILCHEWMWKSCGTMYMFISVMWAKGLEYWIKFVTTTWEVSTIPLRLWEST